MPWIRSVTPLPGHLLDADQPGWVEQVLREDRICGDPMGDLGDKILCLREIGLGVDLDVDQDLGQALALVADAEHLAVADVPDDPGRVAEPRDP